MNKIKYDNKTGRIQELPGMSVIESPQIDAECNRLIRQEFSLEDEIAILRQVVSKNHSADLPKDYASALSRIAERKSKLIEEVEEYEVLADKTKWTEKNKEKLVSLSARIGLPLKDKENLSSITKEIEDKINISITR